VTQYLKSLHFGHGESVYVFRIIIILESKEHYLLEPNEMIGVASTVIVGIFQGKKFIILCNLDEFNDFSFCWKAEEIYRIFTLSSSK
jgi:hypothetical protein